MFDIDVVETQLLLFVVLLVMCVFVMVLLVVTCVDCGKRTEYVRLNKEYLEARDPALQKVKQAEKIRSTDWTDAQYYVRGINKCRLLQEYDLWEIGFRKERSHFLVKQESKIYLLSMVTPGENCAIPLTSESGRNTFREILLALQHPFIQPMHQIDVQTEQNKVAVISLFSDEGSLRDFIFHAKPTSRFDMKYQNQLAKPRPFSRSEIAKFGRQILEALQFLQESGVPYTHLHSGNVIINGDTARISNIENGLLNFERQYERIFRQFRKKFPNIFEKVDLDILSFIFVIYEMSTGLILKHINQLETLGPNINKDITDAIRIVLQEPSNKLTYADIIKLPLFVNVNIKSSDKKQPIVFDAKAKKYLTGINTGANLLRHSSRPEGPKSYITPKATRETRAAMAKNNPKVSSSQPSTPLVSQPSTPMVSQPSTPLVSSTNMPRPINSSGPSVPSTPTKVPPPPPSPVPPPPPSAGAPVPPPPPSVALPAGSEGRGNLLSSIRGFSGGLRKTVTNDRSKPVL